MNSTGRALALGGAVLWLALTVPPVPQILQATMTRQMLVQIPLLAAAGWLVSHVIPRRLGELLARFRPDVAGRSIAEVFADMAAERPAFSGRRWEAIPATGTVLESIARIAPAAEG